jgi:hypothetical protein
MGVVESPFPFVEADPSFRRFRSSQQSLLLLPLRDEVSRRAAAATAARNTSGPAAMQPLAASYERFKDSCSSSVDRAAPLRFVVELRGSKVANFLE